MDHFDFADIEQVNRIELKPGEMIVFRTSEALSDAVGESFAQHFKGTALESRIILLQGDWSIVTIVEE